MIRSARQPTRKIDPPGTQSSTTLYENDGGSHLFSEARSSWPRPALLAAAAQWELKFGHGPHTTQGIFNDSLKNGQPHRTFRVLFLISCSGIHLLRELLPQCGDLSGHIEVEDVRVRTRDGLYTDLASSVHQQFVRFIPLCKDLATKLRLVWPGNKKNKNKGFGLSSTPHRTEPAELPGPSPRSCQNGIDRNERSLGRMTNLAGSSESSGSSKCFKGTVLKFFFEFGPGPAENLDLGLEGVCVQR